MMERIIELLNLISSIQIIPAFTDKKPPKKPYATYQVLNINSADFFGYTERKYIESDKKYIESTEYRIVSRVQFDIFADNQEKVLENAINLRELILFNARIEVGRINAGIIKSSEIKTLNELINQKYEYRATFDIVFEYMKLTKDREAAVVKEIQIIANKKRGGK